MFCIRFVLFLGLPEAVPDVLRADGVSLAGPHALPGHDGAAGLPVHPGLHIGRADRARWESQLRDRSGGDAGLRTWSVLFSFNLQQTEST